MLRFLAVSCSCAACLFSGALLAQDDAKQAYSPYVDAMGAISLPKDFETTFVHLGSISVAKSEGEPVSEQHGTYTRLKDLQAFQRDGKFPDGAILVKDVRATTNEKLTTGSTAYGAEVKVWFVMVKDVNGRFPDNELWGDGWGWGLFEGKDRSKQVAVNYRTECRTCHVPVKTSDWVYTKCYPILQADAAAKRPAAKAPPSNTQSNAELRPKPDLAGMFPQWREAKNIKGDSLAGGLYFESKKVNNSMTCASCHSFNERDTMAQDHDGLIRAGFPIYASVQRTNIKNSGTNLAALGGNVCVLHFMGGKEPGMTATELANLDAFVKSGGDKDHPTAINIDYAKATWTIPEDLNGGDADRGNALAMKTCITCHDVDKVKHRLLNGGLPLHSDSFADADLKELVLQIRNPNYEHNAEMPGYTDLRLDNQKLLDLVAWFRKK